jgi:hypothetical protein
MLVSPALVSAAALTLNGVCELGTCASVDTINPGQSVGGSFSFVYTFANTDRYQITGSYFASTDAAGDVPIGINFQATFLGNSTNNISGTDTLNADLLQKYNWPYTAGVFNEYSSIIFSGPYAPGTNAIEHLSENGQALPNIGPVTTSSSIAINNITLTGLSNPLSSDFNIDWVFAAGSQVGATINETPTPEPGAFYLLGSGVGLLALMRSRRKAARRVN